jgi:hypothetical protein
MTQLVSRLLRRNRLVRRLAVLLDEASGAGGAPQRSLRPQVCPGSDGHDTRGDQLPGTRPRSVGVTFGRSDESEPPVLNKLFFLFQLALSKGLVLTPQAYE